jgi:hypothetical protein
MEPLADRLASKVDQLILAQRTILGIWCCSRDLDELMREGVVKPTSEPDILFYKDHLVGSSTRPGTWITLLDDDVPAENVEV